MKKRQVPAAQATGATGARESGGSGTGDEAVIQTSASGTGDEGRVASRRER